MNRKLSWVPLYQATLSEHGLKICFSGCSLVIAYILKWVASQTTTNHELGVVFGVEKIEKFAFKNCLFIE